ncbi:hypothetical protein HCH_02087 [Hahella chejuensis KCTC 2396]|uniref:Uncharacterized protein n=1 Tax=Hahella chejuensis (strain KCTC 2396) TaxID=349521 RepID=Q2SKA7_HAHCH|nr:hypothetical protein [Hahella chejuensis]ABC28917.1 hypothetical protein HCH_02087 [Hahella chejuensis KCTC 2396]
MKKLTWDDCKARIRIYNGAIAFSINYWRNALAFDEEIFGRLKDAFVFEGPLDEENASVGFFYLTPENRSEIYIERLMRNDLVKLFVAGANDVFYQCIPESLMVELGEIGEFSSSAIQAAKTIKGCEWLILSDGNEHDEPFYLFES